MEKIVGRDGSVGELMDAAQGTGRGVTISRVVSVDRVDALYSDCVRNLSGGKASGLHKISQLHAEDNAN